MRRVVAAVLMGFALGVLPGGAPAGAHGLNTSYTEITVASDRLEVSHRFDVDDLFFHFPVDVNQDRRITPEEFEAAVPGIMAFFGEHLSLTVDGAAARRQSWSHEAAEASVRFTFSLPLTHPPAELALAADAAFFERFGEPHTHLVKVAAGDQVLQAALSADHPRERFSIMPR